MEKGAHKETVFSGGGGSKQASHAEQPSEGLRGGGRSRQWVGKGFPGRTLQEGHLRQGSGGERPGAVKEQSSFWEKPCFECQAKGVPGGSGKVRFVAEARTWVPCESPSQEAG